MKKNEFLYLSSIFISSIGNSITFIATGKILYDQLGIVSVFSSIIVLGHLKSVFTNIIAGWAVDHYSPQTVLTRLNYFLFLSCAIFATLSSFGYLAAALSASLLIINISKPFNRASAFAFVTALTERKRVAMINQMAASFHQAGYFIGLWLGAILVIEISTPLIILTDGITFLLSGLFLTFVSTTHEQTDKAESREKLKFNSIFNDWKIFYHYQKDHKITLHIIIVLSLTLLLIDNYNIYLFKLVALKFDNDPFFISLFESTFSACIILVSYLSNKERIKPIFERYYYFIFALTTISLILLATSNSIICILFAIILFGISIGYIFPSLISQLQLSTKDGVRGKVGASRGIITSILSAPLIFIGSYIGDRVSLDMAYIYIAILSATTLFYYYIYVPKDLHLNKN